MPVSQEKRRVNENLFTWNSEIVCDSGFGKFGSFFWEFSAVPRIGEIFSAPLSEQLQHSREQSQVQEDDNEM
ncbi:Alanine--Glyoxylate Aminotransferase 2 [Manis pentadactyla]|nr:Alanine--Glyoxylate Aminotransferase 2 [Manis pentadactyla]